MLDGEITPEDLAAVNRLEVRLEAAKIVEAAEAAVESGEVTAARAASLILSAGTPAAVAAHDTFLDRTRLAEAAQYRVERLVDALDSDSIEEYAAEYEQRRYNDQVKTADELQAAQKALGQKRLEGLTAQFQKFVEHTPGLDAERLENLINERVAETGSIPDTDADRMRFVREAAHTLGVADEVVGSLREQAKTEIRLKAHEWARTGDVMTHAAWDKRLAAAEEERFQELLKTATPPPDVLKLPLTSQEQTAEAIEHISAKNDRHQAFANQVGGISARAGKPDKDRGSYVTEEKAKFREALARAEANAVPYVPPGLEPKTPQFDEYGPIGAGSGQ